MTKQIKTEPGILLTLCIYFVSIKMFWLNANAKMTGCLTQGKLKLHFWLYCKANIWLWTCSGTLNTQNIHQRVKQKEMWLETSYRKKRETVTVWGIKEDERRRKIQFWKVRRKKKQIHPWLSVKYFQKLSRRIFHSLSFNFTNKYVTITATQ